MAKTNPRFRTPKSIEIQAQFALFVLILIQNILRNEVPTKSVTNLNQHLRFEESKLNSSKPNRKGDDNHSKGVKSLLFLSKSDVTRSTKEQLRRAKVIKTWGSVTNLKIHQSYNYSSFTKEGKMGREKGSEDPPQQFHNPFGLASGGCSGRGVFAGYDDGTELFNRHMRCFRSPDLLTFIYDHEQEIIVMNFILNCVNTLTVIGCLWITTMMKTHKIKKSVCVISSYTKKPPFEQLCIKQSSRFFDLWKNVLADLVCLWPTAPILWAVKTVVFEQSAHWNPSEQHEPKPTLVEETEKSSAYMNSFDENKAMRRTHEQYETETSMRYKWGLNFILPLAHGLKNLETLLYLLTLYISLSSCSGEMLYACCNLTVTYIQWRKKAMSYCDICSYGCYFFLNVVLTNMKMNSCIDNLLHICCQLTAICICLDKNKDRLMQWIICVWWPVKLMCNSGYCLGRRITYPCESDMSDFLKLDMSDLLTKIFWDETVDGILFDDVCNYQFCTNLIHKDSTEPVNLNLISSRNIKQRCWSFGYKLKDDTFKNMYDATIKPPRELRVSCSTALLFCCNLDGMFMIGWTRKSMNIQYAILCGYYGMKMWFYHSLYTSSELKSNVLCTVCLFECYKLNNWGCRILALPYGKKILYEQTHGPVHMTTFNRLNTFSGKHYHEQIGIEQLIHEQVFGQLGPNPTLVEKTLRSGIIMNLNLHELSYVCLKAMIYYLNKLLNLGHKSCKIRPCFEQNPKGRITENLELECTMVEETLGFQNCVKLNVNLSVLLNMQYLLCLYLNWQNIIIWWYSVDYFHDRQRKLAQLPASEGGIAYQKLDQDKRNASNTGKQERSSDKKERTPELTEADQISVTSEATMMNKEMAPYACTIFCYWPMYSVKWIVRKRSCK